MKTTLFLVAVGVACGAQVRTDDFGDLNSFLTLENVRISMLESEVRDLRRELTEASRFTDRLNQLEDRLENEIAATRTEAAESHSRLSCEVASSKQLLHVLSKYHLCVSQPRADPNRFAKGAFFDIEVDSAVNASVRLTKMKLSFAAQPIQDDRVLVYMTRTGESFQNIRSHFELQEHRWQLVATSPFLTARGAELTDLEVDLGEVLRPGAKHGVYVTRPNSDHGISYKTGDDGPFADDGVVRLTGGYVSNGRSFGPPRTGHVAAGICYDVVTA